MAYTVVVHFVRCVQYFAGRGILPMECSTAEGKEIPGQIV